jgi:phosphoglycolate phosphatase
MARLWLFDFDGTLVDSEKAIKACYLKVAQELVPSRCDFIEKMVIGPTLEESSRMILTNKNLHLLDKFKKRFIKLYDEKIVLETQQYPDVHNTLNTLHQQGDQLCIITNKRSHPTYKLVNYYNWENLFIWIACMDDFPEAKNKSDLVKIKNINKNQFECIFLVGDTLSDGICAQEMGVNFIMAKYGYGKNQIWNEITIFKKINNFKELLLV